MITVATTTRPLSGPLRRERGCRSPVAIGSGERADQRHDEAEDVSAAGDVEEAGYQPPTNDAADNADDHIKDDAVSVATDKAPGEGPRNTADDNRSKPTDPFHSFLPTEDRRDSFVPVPAKAVNRGIRISSACEPVDPIMAGGRFDGHAGKEVPFQHPGHPGARKNP